MFSVVTPDKTAGYSRTTSRYRQVRTARHFLMTFVTGALIGCLLALLSFTYLPMIKRHRPVRRVPTDISQDSPPLSTNDTEPAADYDYSGPASRPLRIFCMVLTTYRRIHNIRAINETWAADCDGLMFISDRRLPGGFPCFVPSLAAGAGAGARQGQYGLIKAALTNAPFSGDQYELYLVAPDSVFVAMWNLRRLVSSAAAEQPAAWGLLTRSYVPGAGGLPHLVGRAGLVLSEAARGLLAASDCGRPRYPADTQLALCLRRLGVPQRHRHSFHAEPPAACAAPPPPRGWLERLTGRRTAARRPWLPCRPPAVTFGQMNFATIRRSYFLMNLGVYGRSGVAGGRQRPPP